MLTNPNTVIAEKRDLHFGGLGTDRAATSADDAPLLDSRAMRDVAQGVRGFIRSTPATAAGVASLAPLFAG